MLSSSENIYSLLEIAFILLQRVVREFRDLHTRVLAGQVEVAIREELKYSIGQGDDHTNGFIPQSRTSGVQAYGASKLSESNRKL